MPRAKSSGRPFFDFVAVIEIFERRRWGRQQVVFPSFDAASKYVLREHKDHVADDGPVENIRVRVIRRKYLPAAVQPKQRKVVLESGDWGDERGNDKS